MKKYIVYQWESNSWQRMARSSCSKPYIEHEANPPGSSLAFAIAKHGSKIKKEQHHPLLPIREIGRNIG